MGAYIFDFDYTLGDTTEGILECLSFGLRELGFPPAEREAMRETIGLSLGPALERLTGCSDPEKARAFTRLFMARADQVMVPSAELYPETVALLRGLRARGDRTAIVSTKAFFRIQGILEKFHIPELIDVIVGCDNVKNEKPHPEALLQALERLGAGAGDALYVGDSRVDAECAKRAGVPFAGVLTGTTGREELQRWPHILIGEDLSALREFLRV